MQTSQLIEQLRKLMEQHGDLEVLSYCDDMCQAYQIEEVSTKNEHGESNIVIGS